MTIREACSLLHHEIIHEEWCVCAGIGRENNEEVIYLYVMTTNPRRVRQLAQEGYEGFRVIVRRSGRMRLCRAASV